MNTSDKFAEIASQQEQTFVEQFGAVEFVIKATPSLTAVKLGEYMNDKEIMDKFNPTELTLSEVYGYLETLDHSIPALFYCRDKTGELNPVSAVWNKDGWSIRSYIFEPKSEWRWRGDNYLFTK